MSRTRIINCSQLLLTSGSLSRAKLPLLFSLLIHFHRRANLRLANKREHHFPPNQHPRPIHESHWPKTEVKFDSPAWKSINERLIITICSTSFRLVTFQLSSARSQPNGFLSAPDCALAPPRRSTGKGNVADLLELLVDAGKTTSSLMVAQHPADCLSHLARVCHCAFVNLMDQQQKGDGLAVGRRLCASPSRCFPPPADCPSQLRSVR